MSRVHECLDCKVDTKEINELYFLRDDIWALLKLPFHKYTDDDGHSWNRDGMLCIGCLEKRLGFRLRNRHFGQAPLNCAMTNKKSLRLLCRMHGYRKEFHPKFIGENILCISGGKFVGLYFENEYLPASKFDRKMRERWYAHLGVAE